MNQRGMSSLTATESSSTTPSPASNKRKFDASGYMVVFEELMQQKEARQNFSSYLRDAHNEEPILFLNALASYREEYEQVSLQLDKIHEEKFNSALFELVDRVTEMINIYIVRGAKKELNLPVAQTMAAISVLDQVSNMLESIRSTMKSVDDSLSEVGKHSSQEVFKMIEPNSLFSKIENTTTIDLKMDQFPRYARSHMLEKFLIEKGEDFTRSIAINTNGYTVDIRFKPNDFKSQVLTDRDFYFALALSEDTPDWKLFYSKDKPCKINSYISKTPYVIGTGSNDEMKGMKLMKVELVLPYALDDVFHTYIDKESRFVLDKNLMNDVTLCKYISPDKETAEKCWSNKDSVLRGGWDDKEDIDFRKPPFAVQGVTMGLDLLIPFFKNRDFPHCVTSVYDPELDCIIVTGQTTTFEEQPLHKDRVAAHILFNYLFYRLGDNSTRVIHSIYSSLNVPIHSEFILKQIWKKRSKHLQNGFLNFLKQKTENGTKHFERNQVTDDLNYLIGIKENSEMYPNRSWYQEYKQRNKILH